MHESELFEVEAAAAAVVEEEVPEEVLVSVKMVVEVDVAKMLFSASLSMLICFLSVGSLIRSTQRSEGCLKINRASWWLIILPKRNEIYVNKGKKKGERVEKGREKKKKNIKEGMGCTRYRSANFLSMWELNNMITILIF